MIGGDLDYWGERFASLQLAELVGAGVTHIVDARVEASSEIFVADLAPEVHYLHHGVDDAGQQMPAEWFNVGVDFALDAISSGGVVLTHCHMGINRGPSLGYAVLLGLGWDPIEALDAVRTARPIAAIGYAEDALAWHHDRTGASATASRSDRRRLAGWRRANAIDLETIMRQIRDTEGA